MNTQSDGTDSAPNLAPSRYPRIDAVVKLAHLSQSQIAELLSMTKAEVSVILRYTDTPRKPFRGSRQTAAKGEKQGISKLTEADVRAIRADARSLKTVAAAYGVSRTTIRCIRVRETWRHVE